MGASSLLNVIDQLTFLVKQFAKPVQIHFVLPAAPMLRGGHSDLKLRDLVVEFSRWVLRPWNSYRMNDRRPRCLQSLRDIALEDLGTMKAIARPCGTFRNVVERWGEIQNEARARWERVACPINNGLRRISANRPALPDP